jgi:hypothetical protein
MNCPRCGAEVLNDDQSVCAGCIAEDVAISFEDADLADDDCDDDDNGIDLTSFEYWADECGQDETGSCAKAGSEECDWECPFS